MIIEVMDESIDRMKSKLKVVEGKNFASALWTSKIQSMKTLVTFNNWMNDGPKGIK